MKKQIEKKFLEIRGWKNWKQYDEIVESTTLDINIREELIDLVIKECKNKFKEEIDEAKFLTKMMKFMIKDKIIGDLK